MTAVFGFLVHYWLFTTATVAFLWVIAVHLLRRTEAGPVGRTLARREAKRSDAYLEAVTGESAALRPDGPEFHPDEPASA